MRIKRLLNVLVGGVAGGAVGGMIYLGVYAVSGGPLSPEGTKDLIACMAIVAAGSTIGAASGQIMTSDPEPDSEAVKRWLNGNQVTLRLSSTAHAEILGVLDGH